MQIVTIDDPSLQDNTNDEEIIVGIDFGTTNSLVAISKDGSPLSLSLGETDMLPSVIYFLPDGSLSLKKNDKDQKDSLKLRSIKRLIAKSYSEIINSTELHNLCRDFLINDNGVAKIKFKDQIYTISDLASKIFSHLKEQAESKLARNITKAVISVPAYFNDAQRGQVIESARKAGIETLRLIAEPTSAAYAYGLQHNFIDNPENNGNTGIYMVYDLGGGTFDVSVLSIEDGVFRVIACGGDNNMGGDDIDSILAKYIASEFGQEKDFYKFIEVAKSAKELLSSGLEIVHIDEYAELIVSGESVINSTNTQGPIKISTSNLLKDFSNKSVTTIKKEGFYQLIDDFLSKTINIAKTVKLDALGKLEEEYPSEEMVIEGIILVGGSTRIPLISNKLSKAFSTKILTNIDPDRAVVYGAAIQAENLSKKSKSKTLLIDVLPLSVGIELYGGIVEKIILRNTPIPFAVSRKFTTHADNQTGMKFHIMQGERELAKDNRSLGFFELTNLPPAPAGRTEVIVTFAIDTDGILSVSACETKAQLVKNIDININRALSDELIASNLHDAFSNAALDHNQRLLIESLLEAEELIISLRKAIKNTPEILPLEEMDIIEGKINELERLVLLEDREEIIRSVKSLNDYAYSFIEKHLNFGARKILAGKNINEI